MWQFAPGPPHATPVAGAAVEVFQQRMEAVGTVRYTDRTTASDTHKLDKNPRKCPEIPEEDSGKEAQ